MIISTYIILALIMFLSAIRAITGGKNEKKDKANEDKGDPDLLQTIIRASGRKENITSRFIAFAVFIVSLSATLALVLLK